MTGRTKLLTALALSAAGLWAAVELVYGPVLERYDRATREINKINGGLAKMRPLVMQEARLNTANRNAQADLLSRDRTALAVMLTKLIDDVSKKETLQAELRSARDEARADIFREITYEIEGRGSLNGLTLLIYELDNFAEYLRIRKVTTSTKDGKLSFTLQVSTLELVKVTVPRLEPSRQITFKPEKRAWDGYKPILDKKMFEPYRAPEVKRDPPKEQPKRNDPPPVKPQKPTVFFTGVVRVGDGTVQAIIEDTEKKEASFVKVSDSYGRFKVESISMDKLTVVHGDKKIEVNLGEPLMNGEANGGNGHGESKTEPPKEEKPKEEKPREEKQGEEKKRPNFRDWFKKPKKEGK